jgi:hypothetical protein
MQSLKQDTKFEVCKFFFQDIKKYVVLQSQIKVLKKNSSKFLCMFFKTLEVAKIEKRVSLSIKKVYTK